ncbi:hypothetical protein [Leekyejoonella antrihumi]|uniref:Uncharacterized protein n=1 Tax=Leekyejoonella antrihumi TaxID=1660198 RepID=A0A563E710_9MICO|nr:hypothetical protein [Leekyejoonella antrihumi]TWP38001.1 hypothetical protein FGL98_04655 [Leekyejoonella antrihumi]
MTDDLERRLREAFEAKATSITPSMVEVDRERELADELAHTQRAPRHWMVGGLSAAAAVAAAIGIGFIVSNQQPPTHEPVVAASSQHSSTQTPETTPSTTSSSAPQQNQLAQPNVQQPPATTQAPPATTLAPPISTPPAVKTATRPPAVAKRSTPTTTQTSEPTPSKSDGNYYLRGDLKIAAGTDYLPLPGAIPTYIQDETGRTTRLSTGDCAGIAAYWTTAMPPQGWTQDSALKWTAPSGNAWAFLSKASGACTIQISAGP